ncbi:glycosyltransferase [Pyrofollis japonicus]|uniref:glycosyltransferase n=1 Tax=Pyrofollis japonicus TaxID=3060460 RepID=UPI00295BD87D|nr:glycosyltransferase [Pyrofollis japonicus]
MTSALVIVSVTPEIGLEELYTYAGGLGVLEGDKFLAAGLRGLDYVVLTLFYRKGYVDYPLSTDPVPMEQQHPVDPGRVLKREQELVVTLRGEEVVVEPLVYEKGRAHTVFFNAVHPDWAARLTERVYIEGSEEERLYKYVLLAKASAKYIEERIGLGNVEVVDLQEAYSVLVMFALGDQARYRFITHTPGPWGHPVFPTSILREEFGAELEGDKVVLTLIGFQRAEKSFTVSKKHLEITRKIFPEHADKLDYITNGVCVERWMAKPLKDLLGNKKPEETTIDELREKHETLRRALVSLVARHKPDIEQWRDKPILVWARRITRYKRPYFVTRLLRENPDAANKAFFVLAGKPHPADKEGQAFLREFIALSQKEANVAYIPGYDIEKAKTLLSGGDYLLFTPFSGWEACGTSYMKSMINAVPPISSRDGGALELVEHRVTGWLFGHDNHDFIDLGSEEAKRIDEEDFQDFSTTVSEALGAWRSDEYWKIGLNALKKALREASALRMLRQYYPWRRELQGCQR